MAKKTASAEKKVEVKSVEAVSVNDVPALVATPGKPVNVLVNFGEVEAFLDMLMARYEGMVFTTANLDEVQKAKAAMRALRVQAEKFDKDTKANYFNNPKKLFDTGMAPIYSKIAKIEDKCDAVIAEEDEKRISGVNAAIEWHIAQIGQELDLNGESLAGFVRRKEYYNKTQAELDTVNDLKAQGQELKKRQTAKANAHLQIRKACAQDKRLNVDMYIVDYNDGDDLGAVFSAIDAELERLRNIDKEDAEEEEAGDEAHEDAQEDEEDTGEETEGDPVVETADGLDFESDLPERTKTLTVQLTYPVDVGESLSELFKRLWDLGVKSKVLG